MGLDESGFEGQLKNEDVRERQRIIEEFEAAESSRRGPARYSTRRTCSMAPRITMPMTRARAAPRAMRIPISGVRQTTV